MLCCPESLHWTTRRVLVRRPAAHTQTQKTPQKNSSLQTSVSHSRASSSCISQPTWSSEIKTQHWNFKILSLRVYIQTLLVWFQKEKAWEQIYWVKIYRNACGVSVCIFWGRPLKPQRECCLLPPLSSAASFLRSISWRAFLAEITFHVLSSACSLVPHLS